MKKKMLVILCVLAALLALLIVIVVIANISVIGIASNSSLSDCNEEYSSTKTYDCIVVLGAKVKSDGTPSAMLEDRLRGAVALYQKGVAPIIVLSGDCSGEDYDEVGAMMKYCLDNGVPENALVRDDIGFSTYETMYNVVKAMGYDSVIVVTQRYHLYRALYIAEKMGAEADGFASDYRPYVLQIRRDVREVFARTKDFFVVNIIK